MKKILFLFLLSVSLTMTGTASVQAPVDAQGHALTTSDWVGALPCTINGANQTVGGAPVVCGSSTTITRSVVYGFIASSITATGFLVFRDTIPAGSGGSLGAQSSTVTIAYNFDSSASSSAYSIAGTHVVKFPVPIQFLKGIAVNTDSPMGGSVATWTILYRPMSATE